MRRPKTQAEFMGPEGRPTFIDPGPSTGMRPTAQEAQEIRLAAARRALGIPDSPEESYGSEADKAIVQTGTPDIFEQPAEGVAGTMAGDPGEKMPKPEPMPEPKPKSEHRRFAESEETSYDKVARQPGDRFEYAMKGDRIFVRDTTTDEEFRDVTGIQNEAAIKEVLEQYGSPQEKKDERPHTFRRSGGPPVPLDDMGGRTPGEQKDVEERRRMSPEERILKGM